LDSQLGWASEFLDTLPPSTSDTSLLTGTTFNTNSTGLYISGAAQGVDNDRAISAFGAAPNHPNQGTSFLIDNYNYNFNFQQPFSELFPAQRSTDDTSQEESALLGDHCTPSSSHGKFNTIHLFSWA
jgi:hypothetical protein